MHPFDATEDAGSRQRPGWGGQQALLSTGPGNGLRTSSSSQTGSAANLLGAFTGSLTPFSLGQEWSSCCTLLTGSACWDGVGVGDEGFWAFAADPLSKLTCGGEMPWTGVEQTRLASLVESTQNLCRGPRGTTHFLESVKNRLPWIGRRERALPLKNSSTSSAKPPV